MFKAVDVQDELKKIHIIEQLNNLDFYNTDGMSYRELVHKLAVIKVGRGTE